MTNICLIIAILIIVIFIIVSFRYYQHTIKYPNFRVDERKLISEIYDELNTGDIILFAYMGTNVTNTIFSHTFYTHVGLLVRKGEIMYISETNPAFPYMPKDIKSIKNVSNDEIYTNNGVDLIPLLSRLKYCTGNYYILQLSKPLDDFREKMMQKKVDSRYKYPYPTKPQALISLLGVKIKPKHCWQHVTYLLNSINLLPPEYSDLGVVEVCQKIAEISNIILNDNYYYNNVVQILYDL